MNKASERQQKYDAENTKRYNLKLNIKIDSNIITRLDKVDSMQGYIKGLILDDIKRDNGLVTMYALISIGAEEYEKTVAGGKELIYDRVYTTESIGSMLRKLDELNAGDDKYSIEVYTVDDDGDFYDGSDFDTIENFRTRMAAHK